MLHISSEQRNFLQKSQLRAFIEVSTAQLRRVFSGALTASGQPLDASLVEVVDRWVMAARKRGLLTESQMRVYIHACAILGTTAVETPTDLRVAAVLDDQALAGAKKAAFLAQYIAFTQPRACRGDEQ